MGRKPMITKGCPKCNVQVAVASKGCKCGHTFFFTRRSYRGNSPEIIDERRRTGRVKRVKPNYYDSQEFDNKKKVKKTRQRLQAQPKTTQIIPQSPEQIREKETTAARAKRRRQRKEDEDGGGDLVAK